MIQFNQTTYDFLSYFIDFCGLFFDAALILFLVNHYFSLRRPNLKRNPVFFYGISFFCICGFLYITGFSRDFFWFVFSIFSALFIYSILLFRGSFVMKLSISCIYCSVYFMLDGMYLSLYRYITASFDEIPNTIALVVFFFQRIICKIFMYFIIRFLLKNAADIDSSVPPVYSTCLTVFCGFDILLMLLQIFYLSPMEPKIAATPFLSLFMAGTFAMILCFFYLFTSMIRNYKENICYQLMEKEWALHKQYLDQTRDLLTASRQFRHDIKAHLFCMEGLIEQKKYDELKSYLHQFSNSDFLTIPFQSLCADESLNTLLNQKLKMASNKKIPMKIDVQISNHLFIQKLDLCTILSNLCDNAIEASISVSDPHIHVQLREIKGYLSLTVKNHTKEDVLKNNPSFMTTKKDQNLHGLGITIIQNIVKKYNGSINFSSDSSSFTCFVLLENLKDKTYQTPII